MFTKVDCCVVSVCMQILGWLPTHLLIKYYIHLIFVPHADKTPVNRRQLFFGWQIKC